LDLSERFAGIELTSDHNLTAGRFTTGYSGGASWELPRQEQLQVLPHYRCIQRLDSSCARSTDRGQCRYLSREVGGTVGDIESPSLEAASVSLSHVGPENFVSALSV
jgi:CTP synthase (UTP-ammonia lyase)